MKKKTIQLILFNIINTGTQFLLVIILSRYLSKELYATFRQVFLPFEVLAPLLGAGLSSSMFYFYPRFSNKSNLLFTSIALVFIISLIFHLFFVLGGDYLVSLAFGNISLAAYYSYLAIFAFFSLSNTILYSFFILEDSVKKSVMVNLISNFILIGGVLYLVQNQSDLEPIIGLRIAAYGLIFLLMGSIANPLIKMRSDFYDFIRDAKQVLFYSFPIALSLILGSFSYQLDKLILSFLGTTEEYAVYVNGAFEVPFISILTSALAGASFGIFTSLCKDGNYEAARSLFQKISLASALVIFPCFVFLFYFSSEIITLLFGDGYYESYFFFRVYLLLLPIRIVQYGNVLIALGKTSVLLKRSAIELIIGGFLSCMFYLIFGVKGLAFGIVIAVLFWSVPFNLVVISKGFSIPFISVLPLNKLTRIFISCVIPMLLVHFFNEFVFDFQKIFKLIVSFVLFGFLYVIILRVLKVVNLQHLLKGKIQSL